MFRNFLTITLILLLASACTPWPKRGGGGVAEWANQPLVDAGQFHGDANFQDLLDMRVQNARDDLDGLHRRGAPACFPGQWYEARLQDDRLSRDIAAGLMRDAYKDVEGLNQKIVALQGYMRKVKNKKTCR